MSASRVLLLCALLAIAGPALAQSTIPASSAERLIDGDQGTGTFGAHVGRAGDVNGDGYDDALVGDPGFDGAFVNTGRIALHLGSAEGLSQEPSWTLQGSAPFAVLAQFQPAGDVNGDGFDDIIVDDEQSGSLSLLLGSSASPIPTSWIAGGRPVGSGDTNGDGFADVAVYDAGFIQIFLGSADGLGTLPSTSLQAEGFGLDFGALQDLNGDAYADLAYIWRECGTKDCIFTVGRLAVHLGSESGLQPRPKRTIQLPGVDVLPFVAAAGDLNGDGFGDLAVVMRGDLSATLDLMMFYGNRTGIHPRADIVLQVPRNTVDDGRVGVAGDLNGDGFDDLLLAGSPSPQTLFVLRGGPEGVSPTPSTTIQAEQAFDGFPASPSGAGDVNGDGIGDLIVAAPRFNSGSSPVGRVYVFHGKMSL